ncbi:MAG: two-component sensor histidine kinase [Parasporobacterium sp.]|nr:two-component sensor histidine kinase [Parasporobacterium sp.]
MTKKIFRSIFIVAIVVFFASVVFIMGALYNYYGSVQEKQLENELSLAAAGVEQSGMDYLEKLSGKESRLTWIAGDGTVVFDSYTDPSVMENHAEREEVRKAIKDGTGSSSRYSSTLTEQTLYYAQKLSDGSVLRISISRYTVLALTLSMVQPVLIVLVIALVLSLVLANGLSKKIVKPLESIDLERPLENNAYDELAPMLKRLEMQHRQIRNQREELKERRKEFEAVIRNMNEGLVLINSKGIILSINSSARVFMGAAGDCSGEAFISVERDHRISSMIKDTEKNGSAELQINRKNREYHLSASSVEVDGIISGVAILIFDITEKILAEQNRREFTANVSHELKTPLQSIMGSAELMENRIVKPEDLPQFAHRIRSEASRLVTLIEDIIHLSQLDEKADMPVEDFNLYEMAEEELETLGAAADAKHVLLSLEGDADTEAKGVRQLFHEIIFNLLDNAIKYNVDGGRATVNVRKENNDVVISVSDTGIGIPAEAHERIFERFYRVDKSHSKQIGGTGLGLSIVKHAVKYMDGMIAIDSEPGTGTTVIVTVPR